MARYRKISTFTWNDEKFRSLSDDGQLVWFLLLTHPHMTAIGAMRGTIPGLAAEKNWPEKRFRKAFAEPLAKGMVKYDERSALIWLPNFLKHNSPENPNVVKSWGSALDLLPECALKRELVQSCKEFCEGLPKSFAEGLPQPFRKSMPKQEQEQLQEQEQEHSRLIVCASPVKAQSRPSKRFPETFPREPTDEFMAWAAEECPGIDVRHEWQSMLDHEYAVAKTDFCACARQWMRNAVKFHGGRPRARASPDPTYLAHQDALEAEESRQAEEKRRKNDEWLAQHNAEVNRDTAASQ